MRTIGKDDKEKEDAEDRPYTQYDQLVTRRIQHYYISSAIVEPHLYVEMIQKIQTATPDDIIYIHLNTPGGHLNTGVQIINAMQSSPAHVVVSIEGNCHSLGTLIFLAADEYVVHDNCLMMIHTYSGGMFGKGHEQESQLKATTTWFNTLAKKLYIPFLSSEEFEKVVKGEDLWFQSAEIRNRLQKMVKANKKKLKNVDKETVNK